MFRANVGCGPTPTPGWLNFDNSLSVRLSVLGRGIGLLAKLRLLGADQVRLAETARRAGIRWADAVDRLPLGDGSVSVVYSSHMVEHLDRSEMHTFLDEVWRVLEPGGILRLGVPDLALFVERYLQSGDADAFVSAMLMAHPKPRNFCRRVRFLVVGFRGHHWMYDGPSLVRLLRDRRFAEPVILPPGETTIRDPGDLDLFERADETVYVEARRI